MPNKPAPTIKKSSSLPTILIAGGAGFLGSYLAEKLLETPCRVVVVDNLKTGKRSFIQPLTAHPRFTFLDANINHRLPEEIESVNYIFHLAALEIYLTGEKQIGLDALLTNALGTHNLLNLAKRCQAKFLLASSLDVYRGLLSSQELENYFGATTQEERRFTHAEAKRFAEALTWEAYETDKLDARIVRLGEIYGPRMDLKSSGTLGRLLEEMLTGQDLAVYGEGLEKEYYTHIDDVVRGITRAMFEKNTGGKIYPLTSLEPTTPLELVYLLKDLVGKDLRVVFKPPFQQTPLAELTIVNGESQRDLGWEPKISLREGITGALQEHRLTQGAPTAPTPPQPPILPTPPPLPKVRQKATRRLRVPKISLSFKPFKSFIPFKPPKVPKKAVLLAAGALLTYFVLYPGAALALNICRGQRQLNNFQENFRNLDLDAAEKNAAAAEEHLNAAGGNLDDLAWLFSLTRQNRRQKSLTYFLQTAKYLSAALTDETRGVKPLATAGLNLLAPEADSTPPTDLAPTTSALTSAQEKILLAEAYFKKIDPPTGGRLTNYYQTLETVIGTLKETTPLLKTLTTALPEVLGYQEPQTYFLLFQNSNELRPTGGFIGSYGKTVLHGGRIDKLVVDDVYNLDGLLETKNINIEPPAALKEHLGVSKWLLRDANWNPDFPTAANDIRQFYSLATGEELDGVFAIDLHLVQKLLELTGPIYLAQFNETINSENFFEKTEFYSEADYYSGSPQKKTFLSLLSAKLLEKILQLTTPDLGKLAQIVRVSLTERHLLLYFPAGEVANLLATKNWDGRLRSADGDYLMVVDANVGATKANYYVKRNLNYAVKNTDRQGTWSGTLTINYVHGAASNAWPGGAYKNYLRVYVPAGSVLTKVERSSEGVDTKGLDITGEVNQGEENGKTVFGTVFTLDAGKSLTLVFNYDLPTKEGLLSTNSYSLLVQKQPGTLADPLTVDFLKPFGKDIVQGPEGSERLGDLWRWTGNLREDRELDYSF